MELAIVEWRGIHSTFERAAQKPDWLVERTGFEPLETPSIQPSWIVVSIPLAMNWPHFLVADA
jgi:hypothetical protein